MTSHKWIEFNKQNEEIGVMYTSTKNKVLAEAKLFDKYGREWKTIKLEYVGVKNG